MEFLSSIEQEMIVVHTYSAEMKRLTSFSTAVARSVDASRLNLAASALGCSAEMKRLTSFSAAVARSVDASGLNLAASALARSAEMKRLTGFSAAVARSVDASGLNLAASALARSAEMKRLTGFSAAVARSVNASGLNLARSALVSSENAKRVVNFDATMVRTADERDEAANQVGLNPELIAPPCDVNDKDFFLADFKLSIVSVPVPKAIEEADSCATFNPQHWQILNELEQRLRQEVEQHLKKFSGSSWIRRRIPQAVRKRWLERQEEDRAAGRPVYDAIQYADFMDLADIIKRKDNWREIFQSIFGDANDIAVSLRRLHPVRKALAHSRPLGRTDVLTLVSEATRIFRALGVRILH